MSKKTLISNPVVVHTSNEKGVMKFTLEKTNVSIANAIRRTILSDIKVVCLKTDTITDNLIKIHSNTTRLNNEITNAELSNYLKKYVGDEALKQNNDQEPMVSTQKPDQIIMKY